MNVPEEITKLDQLIAHMEPVLHEGEYIFTTVKNTNSIPREITICEIKEKEGITLILRKEDADKLSLSYDFIASWITLNVHSALEAVGLTAAFATELGKHNISCNVIAGFYHDHIFVSQKDGGKAVRVLKNLSMTKRIELGIDI